MVGFYFFLRVLNLSKGSNDFIWKDFVFLGWFLPKSPLKFIFSSKFTCSVKASPSQKISQQPDAQRKFINKFSTYVDFTTLAYGSKEPLGSENVSPKSQYSKGFCLFLRPILLRRGRGRFDTLLQMLTKQELLLLVHT